MPLLSFLHRVFFQPANMMASQKIEKPLFSSFRRKPESRNTKDFWTPAFAGVTAWKTFYETVKHITLRISF
jgi:hypothetical protein